MNVLDIGEALRDCLCGFLADTPAGPVCRCSLYPSFDIPFDICSREPGGDGQAAVALVRTFPSRNFPFPVDPGEFSCDYYLAAEYVLQVVRCAPKITSSGKLPTPEALDAAAAIVMADANAMRCAVSCCLDRRPFQIQSWESFPLAGGCMGGTLNVVVQSDDVACLDLGSS